MANLKDFMVSKVRVKLISFLLNHPEEMYYIRELTRLIDEEINAVRRELIHMKSVGMVRVERRSNRLYYSFNRHYLFHKELLNMVAKTSGLGKAIIKIAPKLGKLKFAMISGRFMRKMPRLKDTVDLLLVGDIIMPQVTDFITSQEAKLNRQINYTVMTMDELNYRKSHNDPFIQRILMGSRIMIIGDEEDLVN